MVNTANGLSPSATWDRLTWDAAGRRLFLGLRNDGVVALPFGAPVGGLLGAAGTPFAVANSSGCNGFVVAGALGFAGEAAGFTGTGGVYGKGVTVYNMSTMAVVRTLPVANGVGVDNGVYDANSQQVIFTLVNGSLFTVSALTGAPLKTGSISTPPCDPSLPCDPLQFPVVDGSGGMYVTVPMENAVLKIDTRTLAQLARFDTKAYGCLDPTGLALDTVNARLLVGCGDAGAPQLLALDARTGARMASVPIGRGNDGVVYDAQRRLIFASSGAVGTITVVQQYVDTSGADSYAVREALFTKAGARTLAYDPQTGAVFTMAPDGRYNPALPVNADMAGGVFTANEFVPNSIEVLVYQPTWASSSGRRHR